MEGYVKKPHLRDFEFAKKHDYETVDNINKEPTFLVDVLSRFRKKKAARTAFIIILIFIILSILVPAVSSRKYYEQNIGHAYLPPKMPLIDNIGIFDGKVNSQDMYKNKEALGTYYIFGTDELGRDIWVRV